VERKPADLTAPLFDLAFDADEITLARMSRCGALGHARHIRPRQRGALRRQGLGKVRDGAITAWRGPLGLRQASP
jgi:hypothetical protein